MRTCTCVQRGMGENSSPLEHYEDCPSLTTVEEDSILNAITNVETQLKTARKSVEDMFDPAHSKGKYERKSREFISNTVWPLIELTLTIATEHRENQGE